MSYDDFCRCTPEEFTHISNAYQEQQESMMRSDWERMRMLATLVIQPFVKSTLTPQKLLPFDWDETRKRGKKEKPRVSKEEDRQRLEKLLKRRRG